MRNRADDPKIIEQSILSIQMFENIKADLISNKKECDAIQDFIKSKGWDDE